MNKSRNEPRNERRTPLHRTQQAIRHQVQKIQVTRPGQVRAALRAEQSRARTRSPGGEARAEAAQALVRFDVPAVTNPYRELARIAGQQIAYKDKVGEILNRLSVHELRYAGSLRGEQTRAEIGMWQDSTRQCVSVQATPGRVGRQERRARSWSWPECAPVPSSPARPG